MAKKADFIKEPLLVENPLFLEGISRSGKFFLGKLVSALDRVEYFQYVTILEHISFIERLGGVTEDAAIALLRSNVNEHIYHMKIGRNLNLRHDDASSLVNSPAVEDYLKRAASPISETVVNDIRSEDKYYPFVLHEGLPNIGIYFKAFPALRCISLRRHPVDLVHSLYLRGWGHRLASDPLAFIPTLKSGKGVYPWYAKGWEKEYQDASEMDGIIKSVIMLMKMGDESYSKLSDKMKKQILVVHYEDLVEDTSSELGRIAGFLDAKPVKALPDILKRERCPQKISREKHSLKEQHIKTHATKPMYKEIMSLSSKYEKGRGR